MNEEYATQSLTALLKAHGSPVSAKEANTALLMRGLLDYASRPSTDGTATRVFKILTPSGLRFGRNEHAPTVKDQTSPKYFEETFPELLSIILGDEAD